VSEINRYLRKVRFFLPPLHINLGLMKSFIKALNKRVKGFKHLREKFPELGDAKGFKLD
jgi:hypothetical protein